MRDSANFCRLCNSFMFRSSDYLKGVLPKASNASQPSIQALAQSTMTVPSARPDILEVLAAYPRLHVSSALSCISYAGHHILSKLAPPSYLQALMHHLPTHIYGIFGGKKNHFFCSDRTSHP